MRISLVKYDDDNFQAFISNEVEFSFFNVPVGFSGFGQLPRLINTSFLNTAGCESHFVYIFFAYIFYFHISARQGRFCCEGCGFCGRIGKKVNTLFRFCESGIGFRVNIFSEVVSQFDFSISVMRFVFVWTSVLF